MLMNKLSELKDVADYWRKVKSGELPAPGLNEISITTCTLDGAVSRISAMLAELEASKKSNALLKEQLSQLANFNPDWDMLEACRESWREASAALKEAETRLATPVRLPDVLFIGRYPAPLMRAEQVKERISAAGFTVEGAE